MNIFLGKLNDLIKSILSYPSQWQGPMDDTMFRSASSWDPNIPFVFFATTSSTTRYVHEPANDLHDWKI